MYTIHVYMKVYIIKNHLFLLQYYPSFVLKIICKHNMCTSNSLLPEDLEHPDTHFC